MHEPNQPKSHGGVLKSSEPETGEVFEFGGHKLPLKGTSGPAKERSRTAEGRPIRHNVMIASPTIPTPGASGASQVERRVAAGRPVQHRADPKDAADGLTGSGQLIGGPVRCA